MNDNIKKVATELFNKIRSRFEVSTGGENAEDISNPDEARIFNFNYETRNGTRLGNITLSIVSERNLKCYITKEVTDTLGDPETSDEDKEEWKNWLEGMRYFAKRNGLMWDVRDLTKNNLDIRDIKSQANVDRAQDRREVKIKESLMYGSSKSSYQNIGQLKLIIRHSGAVDESVQGSRARNISAIFVENELGERMLLPFKKLSAARAMAEHLANGGELKDTVGQKITEMVTEMNHLGWFARTMKNRTFEDTNTKEMVEAAIGRYNELNVTLKELRTHKGYRKFVEAIENQPEIISEDPDYNELRERFVKKIYQERMNDALPYVYQAYVTHRNIQENTFVKEIENWVNSIELTEAEQDDGNEDIIDRQGLEIAMEKPIRAGLDGIDAISTLQDIIKNDDLYDEIYDISQGENGQEVDVRPIVNDWLRSVGEDEIAFQGQHSSLDSDKSQPAPTTAMTPAAALPAAAPAAPPVPAMPTPMAAGAAAMPEPLPQPIPQPVAPAGTPDELQRVRQLAGLRPPVA